MAAKVLDAGPASAAAHDETPGTEEFVDAASFTQGRKSNAESPARSIGASSGRVSAAMDSLLLARLSAEDWFNHFPQECAEIFVERK